MQNLCVRESCVLYYNFEALVCVLSGVLVYSYQRVWIKRGDTPYIFMLGGCLQPTGVAHMYTFHTPSVTQCKRTGCT